MESFISQKDVGKCITDTLSWRRWGSSRWGLLANHKSNIPTAAALQDKKGVSHHMKYLLFPTPSGLLNPRVKAQLTKSSRIPAWIFSCICLSLGEHVGCIMTPTWYTNLVSIRLPYRGFIVGEEDRRMVRSVKVRTLTEKTAPIYLYL